ncbi:UvrD-helicase domain-containing protein [Coprobacter sp.]
MLHVYRASAGSGKTYKLTLEYLKLLLSPVRFENEPVLPADRNKAFQHILAVTFTNKATEEMKRRIIEKLDILAHRTQESEYLNDLLGKNGITADIKELQYRASEILFTLLHDFSGFNISTIDKFFQQTARAFTREIGLQGGYNTEIDNTHVLTEAIDRMFFDLENPENKELLNWLLRFSEEQVEGGKSWGIQRNINQLAQELFKEEYKSHSSEIRRLMADKEILKTYIRKLNTVKRDFETESREIAQKAVGVMRKSGLSPDDMKGGSRSPFKEFQKWADGNIKEPTGTFAQLESNVENWYTKKTPPDVIIKIHDIYAELNGYIEQIIACYNTYPFYISVMETRRYIYTLGILSDIDNHIQAYEKEHNILLLSDTTELLNRIIDGSDTPFVYEKTGTRIDHFMIDEFQDTSRMQWCNFFPLIKESNDKGGCNLIVGDVKQSIYRWRNSDWKLLNDELGNQFKKPEELTDHILETNWRSCINVVQFNNSFFRKASFVLQESLEKEIAGSPVSVHIDPGYAGKIGKAYRDIYQHISPKNNDKEGHVKILFQETETEEGEKLDWKKKVIELLPETLKELQDKNIALKDIAILVRSKAEGSLVADCLLSAKSENPDSEYRFDIISDEALFIRNAPIVKLVIGILNYLQNPEIEINRILAVYEYSMAHRNLSPETALTSYFAEKEKDLQHHFDPEIVTELELLKNAPLFEMCEKIIGLFPRSGERNEGIFIQAFQDIVLDYTTNHSADTASFLQWWNEQGVKKTINTPEAQNAIRIMTIHKSKGLEFKAVIIPFCD